MTNLSRDEVEAKIKSAFARVTLGKGVSIRQSVVIDNCGEGCSDLEFRSLPMSEETSDWLSVSDAELEIACIGHFDADGLRYYLPALLLSINRNYDGTSLRVIGTIMALYPKANDMKYHLERYKLLNEKQRKAITSWLANSPNFVQFKYDEPKELNRAIRNFWGQYV